MKTPLELIQSQTNLSEAFQLCFKPADFRAITRRESDPTTNDTSLPFDMPPAGPYAGGR